MPLRGLGADELARDVRLHGAKLKAEHLLVRDPPAGVRWIVHLHSSVPVPFLDLLWRSSFCANKIAEEAGTSEVWEREPRSCGSQGGQSWTRRSRPSRWWWKRKPSLPLERESAEDEDISAGKGTCVASGRESSRRHEEDLAAAMESGGYGGEP